MEKPTIIITGGTGFIGSHTCVELINSYNLVVIDNLFNSKKEVIDKIKQILIEFFNVSQEGFVQRDFWIMAKVFRCIS